MAKKKGFKKEKKHIIFDEKERTYVNIFSDNKIIGDGYHIVVDLFLPGDD